jgi:hypothetical protein
MKAARVNEASAMKRFMARFSLCNIGQKFGERLD